MAGTKKGKARRKRCTYEGCKRLQVDGTDRCPDHQKPAEGLAGAPDGVCQLSELDLLKFLRSDTELHNHKLEIKNVEQEHVIDQAEFSQRRQARQNRIKLLQQSIRQREVQQRVLLEELGKKYGFDHSIASIDDQTGIVHEHSPKER